MTTPQGQFIATESSVLAKFLANAKVKATFSAGPCVPAAAQVMEDRLRTDESAIAAQKDLISHLQSDVRGLQGRDRKMLIGFAGGAGVLGFLVLLLLIFRRRSRPSKSKSES
jgi:hypothetical protein